MLLMKRQCEEECGWARAARGEVCAREIGSARHILHRDKTNRMSAANKYPVIAWTNVFPSDALHPSMHYVPTR